jgi:riboflavin kinase/FMN adenylyltransferase
MHRGHRHLLERASERALALGLPVLVITFDPIPAQVLRPESFDGRLTTFEQKIGLIREVDDPMVAVLPFTREFACTTAEEFFGQLAGATTVRELWVGEEFALGKDRLGTIDQLIELGKEIGFAVVALDRVSVDGEIVSSTRIRNLIRQGDVANANRLLGRRFSVRGEVCEGARLGRTIGFPTANVLPPLDLVMVADGIYASLAYLGTGESALPAMTYIGTRPALNPGSRVFETHLFDFDRDIYGEILTTEFVQHLRGDSNYESVDALIAQMKLDELDARSILAAHPAMLGKA